MTGTAALRRLEEIVKAAKLHPDSVIAEQKAADAERCLAKLWDIVLLGDELSHDDPRHARIR